METRCCKSLFPNYSKRKSFEDTLVPPLREKLEHMLAFDIICSRGCTRQNLCFPPVLHRPQKKNEEPIFRTNPRLEAPLPPFFLRTTFRISAITPASPLIEKFTTLRSSLWCSHCSVGKRQQFSCPLGTATLSLKLENVVPGCWICFLLYCSQVFF